MRLAALAFAGIHIYAGYIKRRTMIILRSANSSAATVANHDVAIPV